MIRHAIAKDIPAIMDMVREFYATTDYAKFAPFDEDTVQALAELITFQHIMIVATDDSDTPIGLLALMLSPFPYNRNILSCVEVAWWVKSEFRKSSFGVDMIRYADNIRKLRGATNFQLARLNTSPEGLDSVYESLGFTFSEKYFSKVN